MVKKKKTRRKEKSAPKKQKKAEKQKTEKKKVRQTKKSAKKAEKPKKVRKKAAKKKTEPAGKKESGVTFTTGKRKRSVARATVRPGSGKVVINGRPLENIKNEVVRLRIGEPFQLTGKEWKSYDFSVSVKGGGIMGQADAVRQAFARGLVEIFGSDLKQKFLDYDRNLLVYDPRRTETHKPPRSSQGSRRYKQRSKR